jgi:hypothetical protein
MNANDELRMKKLLKEALPPVEDDSEPGHDLWPAVFHRLDARSAVLPWFDWALGAGLVTFAAFFPASIPVFLYYL